MPAAVDLRTDGLQAKREHKPIIIFFSLPECHYCHVVRENYLIPMLRDASAKQRPIIREIDMTDKNKVVGFDGKNITRSAIVKNMHVRVAPTLVFLDAEGKQLTEPLIGGDTVGFYDAYLQKTLNEATQKMSASSNSLTKNP